MSTRIIGGIAYPITEIRNAIGMEWIPAVTVTHSQIATIGEPVDAETFLVVYNNDGTREVYAWDGAKWFHLFGGGAFDMQVADGYLQYQEHDSNNWHNLIALSALQASERRIDTYTASSDVDGAVAVTYTTAFDAQPMLFLECVPPAPHGVTVRKLTETVSGFTAIVEGADAVAVSGQSIKAYVIAV